MKKTIIILSVFTISAISCGQTAKKEDKAVNTESKISLEREKEQIQIEENLLIREKGVDIFGIGEKIPFKAENYTIKKDVIYLEEAIEEPIYKVYEKGKEILNIRPEFDYDKEQFTDKIGSITIISAKFKTPEGIRVGSSISEFKSIYPDFNKVYFSYIGWHFWIETNQYKLSFELDEKDYTGGEIEFDSDLTILKVSDFKKASKITSIRIQ